MAGPGNVILRGGTYFLSTPLVLGPEDSFAKWQAAGLDAHSHIADPLIVDSEHGDYHLRPDSPVLALGFQPLPLEKVGPGGYVQDER